jgi:hypothetical protein
MVYSNYTHFKFWGLPNVNAKVTTPKLCGQSGEFGYLEWSNSYANYLVGLAIQSGSTRHRTQFFWIKYHFLHNSRWLLVVPEDTSICATLPCHLHWSTYYNICLAPKICKKYGTNKLHVMIASNASSLMCKIRKLVAFHKLEPPLHGESTPLSSRTPRARQKNLFFLSCITKMGQNFINCFSWVDIHGIYYLPKIRNQIWWYFF